MANILLHCHSESVHGRGITTQLDGRIWKYRPTGQGEPSSPSLMQISLALQFNPHACLIAATRSRYRDDRTNPDRAISPRTILTHLRDSAYLIKSTCLCLHFTSGVSRCPCIFSKIIMEDPPVATDAEQHRAPGWWQAVSKRVLLLLLHQWLLIGIGVACVLAYFFPSVAKHGGVIRSEYSVLYGVIAIIFLISGLSIPRQKLFTQFMNWRLHLGVQVISFLFIPALVLAVVHIILAGDPAGHIDRAVLAGYILTACIPTTIASNVVMTRSAGGDDAAALVEVLLANILGPFVTAAWTVTLLPKTTEFDPWRYGGGSLGSMYRAVFQQLGLSVLLPLFIGQLVRWTWPERTALILEKTKLPKLASVCMLLLIWYVLDFL